MMNLKSRPSKLVKVISGNSAPLAGVFVVLKPLTTLVAPSSRLVIVLHCLYDVSDAAAELPPRYSNHTTNEAWRKAKGFKSFFHPKLLRP